MLYIFLLWLNSSNWAWAASLLRFLDQTQTHIKPVELLCKGDQLVAEATSYATHNKHKRQTSVPSTGFEPFVLNRGGTAGLSPRQRGHHYREKVTLSPWVTRNFFLKHWKNRNADKTQKLQFSEKELLYSRRQPAGNNGETKYGTHYRVVTRIPHAHVTHFYFRLICEFPQSATVCSLVS